jgi:long-chain fatty acid transport protein
MNNILRGPFSKTILAICIASASTVSQAGSFGLIEQSASGQGVAYAGAAAVGEDASTIYFNPAGMTRLSGQQIVVAGHIVSPKADFTNNGSTNVLGSGPGSELTGPNSSTGDPAFIPNFYYSAELPNEIYVGVGVNVPFGLSTEYDDGWVGRYHGLKSEITTINVNPSIAWKASEKVSIGFGISIQYADLELTNNLDSAATCARIEAVAGPLGCDYTTPSDATLDSSVKLAGDSTELGWNTGILIDLDEKSRLGIAYRSAIKHNVSGNSTYNLDGTLNTVAGDASDLIGFNILQDTTLEATAELPETFSVSFAGDLNAKWTVLADWTWTGWSSLDVITIVEAGGLPGTEKTLNLAYNNTNRFSIGAHFKPNQKWIYRGGLALDQTPIQSPELTTARIPGNDRTWLSFGLGYKPSSTWSLDFGYSHLFISDTDINNGPPQNEGSSFATLTGTYESSVDILSAQANFNF